MVGPRFGPYLEERWVTVRFKTAPMFLLIIQIH